MAVTYRRSEAPDQRGKSARRSDFGECLVCHRVWRRHRAGSASREVVGSTNLAKSGMEDGPAPSGNDVEWPDTLAQTGDIWAERLTYRPRGGRIQGPP